MFDFSGKVVVITGAASGIGAATAARFAKAGARLVLADLNLDGLTAMAGGLSVSTDDLALLACDVASQADVEAVIATAVQQFGRLDVLVNDAGMGAFGSVPDTDPEVWRRVIAVNLDSVFYGARAAIPHLIETAGCIVNTASISGLAGDYGFAPYNAAKAGVINLTRTLAMDHGKDGVRVNAVGPGLVRTPLASALHEHPVIMGEYRERVPLGRAAEPDEIARPILFLASSAASYITGEILTIDGGLRAATGQPNFTKLFTGANT